MKTVAVIQPYFVPYAGYFRLFAAADVVVMLDCVQFPRRGWVHRNRLPLHSGELDWLTLPLAKAGREALISELRFPPDVRERLLASMRRFPLLDRGHRERAPLVERILEFTGDDAAGYLCDLVGGLTTTLGITRPTIRSSTLGIPPELRAQERIIAIVQAVGGTRYVNPSGGRELYDPGVFAASGIDLRFLTPFAGGMESILARLLCEPVHGISSEILRETILVP